MLIYFWNRSESIQNRRRDIKIWAIHQRRFFSNKTTTSDILTIVTLYNLIKLSTILVIFQYTKHICFIPVSSFDLFTRFLAHHFSLTQFTTFVSARYKLIPLIRGIMLFLSFDMKRKWFLPWRRHGDISGTYKLYTQRHFCSSVFDIKSAYTKINKAETQNIFIFFASLNKIYISSRNRNLKKN